MDNSATTPVRQEVIEAMSECMKDDFGNPSSLHWFGRQARRRMETAREQVAGLIGAEPEEIVFTSGGTEADNMVMKGVTQQLRHKGRHVITSSVEHHAILHTGEYLEKNGFDVTYLAVDEHGRVDPDHLRHAIGPQTTLVSIMLANNEVGTIQPIEELAAICRENGVLFHTDAVQGVGQLDVDVETLGVDFLSLSGHKLYGPKGVGALYVRRNRRFQPLFHGGGHERRRRAGTENIPGIVGLGLACQLSHEELPERREKLVAMRDGLIAGLIERVEDVQLNGHPSERLPNNCNLSFNYVEGEAMLLNLDLQGIAVASGSACTSGSIEPSHVLLAMGVSRELAQGSLRLSLGSFNCTEDVDYVLETLPPIVDKLRQMSPLYHGKE